MVNFLDLYSQYKAIKPEIDNAVHSVIFNSAYIGGEYVGKFEKEFASYQGTKHCVGVGNGTDALEIAIESLSLPANSEIIVPANSFVASSEAVTRAGHKVVFCDCDPVFLTVSIEDLKKRITKNTVAIMAVHLYGHSCDMDALLNIAEENNLKIIEDCAQAHGAQYKGQLVGGIGDIGTFSFYPGKNLGAYGDGGAITTNNDELALRCRKIANHGRTEKYSHEFEGRNSRLDGLQAAILSVKLKHLDEWTNQRIVVAEAYDEALNDCGDIELPQRNESVKHVYHLYVIRTSKRDELKKHLQDKGVQTGVHYPIALPKLSAYQYLGQNTKNFFACENDCHLLSLPMGGHLTVDNIAFVANAINVFFKTAD